MAALRQIAIYGNLTLSSTMTISAAGGASEILFPGAASRTVTSNGKTLASSIYVQGGTVTLQDALNTTGLLSLDSGTFDANNQSVTVSGFASNNTSTRTLTMGSGLWTLSGTSVLWNLSTVTNLTFNKGAANILLSNATASSRNFNGGSLTYNKLTIGGATGSSVLTISGSNTFSEIASTKTVAHTITLTNGTTQTVTTWSAKGASSGARITVNSSSPTAVATLAKAGGGYLTGVDYLSVRNVSFTPLSDTWYIGSGSVIDTTPGNIGRGAFTVQRSTAAVVVLTSTSAANWTVPSDWNSQSNVIHLIGGGGGGASGAVSGNPRAGGGGGGGGGYTKLVNKAYNIGGTVSYQAGAAGTIGGNGGSTSWDSGTYTAGGGSAGSATAIPLASAGGSGGTGATFNGAPGGAGSTANGSGLPAGGGGGGGAASQIGMGGAGGVGNASSTLAFGGGGGANGGGSSGGNATTTAHGVGGNNYSGVGGATAAATAGAAGGGGAGAGSSSNGGVGSYGVSIYGIDSGSGGGGGSGGATSISGAGSAFGGGGGGGGVTTGNASKSGNVGGSGAIIITYTPSSGVAGNFLQFF